MCDKQKTYHPWRAQHERRLDWPYRHMQANQLEMTPAPMDYHYKRTLHSWLAILGLLVAWPLMVVIALLIKLDSPGPALLKQMRVGYQRRQFAMYKFRTMFVENCTEGPKQRY